MLSYSVKKGLLNFHIKSSPEEWKLADAFRFVSYNHVLKKFHTFLFIKEKSNTLLFDLKPDKEAIFSGFGKYCRYKIRRSEKEGMIISFEHNIDSFVAFYNDFAKSKGQPLLDARQILKFPNLIITKVVHNNSDLAMHSYVVDKELKLARLITTSSVRFNDSVDSGMVGRANRMLHYQDMLYFKSQGCETYDFGTIVINSEKKEHQSIAEFKRSFGGELVDEYTYMSIPYWIMIKLKRITAFLFR